MNMQAVQTHCDWDDQSAHHDVFNIIVVTKGSETDGMQQANKVYEIVLELIVRLRLQR